MKNIIIIITIVIIIITIINIIKKLSSEISLFLLL